MPPPYVWYGDNRNVKLQFSSLDPDENLAYTVEKKRGGGMELRWVRLNGRDGHTVGRELLAEMVGDRQILVTDRGKPYFAGDGPHFSISHTKKHVFCCVSERNVGIDAEELDRPVNPLLYRRILSPEEQARLDGWQDRAAGLLRLWVLKESYAKLTGRGIGDYLKNTDFDPNDSRIQIIDGCYVVIMEE